jgi:DNA polymerase
VFASKSERDGLIEKVKLRYKTVDAGLTVPDTPKFDKFANTPERCFLENGNIVALSVPAKLDKQYYIDLANERLRQFGGV